MTLSTRPFYLGNGIQKVVLAKIYDSEDCHGNTLLAKVLLQSGGFYAITTIENAGRIVRDVLIRTTSPLTGNSTHYVLITASEQEEEKLEEIVTEYHGFSPEVGHLPSESTVTADVRTLEQVRQRRGVLAIPDRTVKKRHLMLQIHDSPTSRDEDIYCAILTVELMPYTSENVEMWVR